MRQPGLQAVRSRFTVGYVQGADQKGIWLQIHFTAESRGRSFEAKSVADEL